MTRILFVSSEAHPLVKTGGLGDVSASLPAALQALGEEVRLVIPAYQSVLRQLAVCEPVASIQLANLPSPVRILAAVMPDSEVPLWLIDSPECFDRAGGPYASVDGRDWADNALRFTVFSRAVAALAMGRAGLDWRPDVVHCNDWQSGLVPALLSLEQTRPKTVFTIHNLAYQGLFPLTMLSELRLPERWASMEALEFHGQLSFIKGGLVFADWLTTVSPTYAEEIKTPEFGYGLDGLLNHRADRLVGLLNGADYQVWDPARDPLIPKNYGAKTLADKQVNKRALQKRLQLQVDAERPLVGLVGRMVEQKGIDLLLECLPALLQRGVQVAVVGSGEPALEEAFQSLAEQYPDQVGVFIGYSEELAHWVEAGADMFLMPSRFEPCGLNQIYSLRYGTLPVVRRTGGLADTVIDTTEQTVAAGTATGFVFDEPTAEALSAALERALQAYATPRLWQALQQAAMAEDFSWETSARHYLTLYADAPHTGVAMTRALRA